MRRSLGGATIVMFALAFALASCAERPSSATEDGEAHAISSEAPMSAPPVALEGGLVIQDLALGNGAEARASSVVEIEFVARFASGEVWDSSEMRRRTLRFELDNSALIEGLRRGIPGMRVGGTRRIEIPWALGYGATGRDPVPPRADLVYEVNLVAIHDIAE